MDKKQEVYRIIITKPAKERYYQVLDYIYEYYTENRANEIALELLDYPDQLSTFPKKGSLEENLSHRSEGFRYILYKRAAGAQIKIIYFTDDEEKIVYITDFFPTEMNHRKIKYRS